MPDLPPHRQRRHHHHHHHHHHHQNQPIAAVAVAPAASSHHTAECDSEFSLQLPVPQQKVPLFVVSLADSCFVLRICRSCCFFLQLSYAGTLLSFSVLLTGKSRHLVLHLLAASSAQELLPCQCDVSLLFNVQGGRPQGEPDFIESDEV